MASKTELTHFLDQHVFNPILKASPSHYSENDKSALQDVQSKTKTEQQRYHDYPSTAKIVEMYKSDLTSENAHKVNAELKRLKLPILADVKDEFLKLAG